MADYNPVTYLLAALRTITSEGWVWNEILAGVAAVAGVGVVWQGLAFAALRSRVGETDDAARGWEPVSGVLGRGRGTCVGSPGIGYASLSFFRRPRTRAPGASLRPPKVRSCSPERGASRRHAGEDGLMRCLGRPRRGLG